MEIDTEVSTTQGSDEFELD